MKEGRNSERKQQEGRILKGGEEGEWKQILRLTVTTQGKGRGGSCPGQPTSAHPCPSLPTSFHICPHVTSPVHPSPCLPMPTTSHSTIWYHFLSPRDTGLAFPTALKLLSSPPSLYPPRAKHPSGNPIPEARIGSVPWTHAHST